MLNIHHSFNLKVFGHIFLIVNFVLTLGFLNESWMSLVAWLTLFMCIYSGSISLNISRWLLVIEMVVVVHNCLLNVVASMGFSGFGLFIISI